MKSFDVLLIGNAVEDWIFDGTKEPIHRWGGIYNVKRALNECGIFDIAIEPSDFGKAYIKIDRENSSKWVNSELQLVSKNPEIKKAKWTHIAYGDDISWHPFFPNKETITSIDLCKKDGFFSCGSDIDYIFCSAEEYYGPNIYCEKHTKIIEHSPKRIDVWQNKKNLFSIDTTPLAGLAVLGAGDYFAAAFISEKLKGKDDFEAVKKADTLAREWLLSQ